MKKRFKVYKLAYEYYVLKCPNCGYIFRFTNPSKKESRTAKCQKCEERFIIKRNCLSEDPLGKPWEDAIIIKPNNTLESVSYKKNVKQLPKLAFKSAFELEQKYQSYVG